MNVRSQSPQPIIKCFHSIIDGKAAHKLYQEFTPSSLNFSGKNLQSYNFERSLDDFGGNFSFTVKEDIEDINTPEHETLFMDRVQSLDVIVISENGSEKIDFIGVVTKISIGGVASNLNKVITVSGKSIEWLFLFYNINADISAVIFQNEAANNSFKLDLASKGGNDGYPLKDVVKACITAFRDRTAIKEQGNTARDASNYVIGDIIDLWFGTDYINASSDKFLYPISSNLFDSGKINVIDYIRKLLPPPVYEIFCEINSKNKPVLTFRKVPFDNPTAEYSIDPDLLTDFTQTKNCEEVYTAFLPYLEGSSQSPEFYIRKTNAEGLTIKGYNASNTDADKIKIFGFQLLTCSFVGYNSDEENSKTTMDNMKILSGEMKKWFSNMDEMYSGDFTLVNITDDSYAKIGEWIKFAGGLFYITAEKHNWMYGENPTINYQVIRGGDYTNGEFKPLKRISASYREFD